jgi:methionyl-tRNA formyltransferase
LQRDDEATYAGRINKADALIDWSMSAVEIDRRIRAYNPWPVAFTTLDGLRMRCWAAEPVTAPVDAPDVYVSDAGIEVQTGEGVLRITELQMPGKQKMRAKDFANGYPVLMKCLGRQE